MTEIREYRKATRCERGGRLRRCRGTIAGQCQYCALGFCERHGLQLEDGQQICLDTACQRKMHDVARHIAFKAEAAQRNQAGRCGIEDCQEPHTQDCERCLRDYCSAHVVDVVISVVRGSEHAVEVIRLCRHCHSRLDLWSNS